MTKKAEVDAVLATLTAHTSRTVTTELLTAVLADIGHCETSEVTCAREETDGWSQSDIADTLVDYGQFVTSGNPENVPEKILRYTDHSTMLWPPTNHELVRAWSALTQGKASVAQRDMWHGENIETSRFVVVSDGWAPHDRDGRLAVAMVAALYQSNQAATVADYVSWARDAPAATLQRATTIHLIAWLAMTGLWDRLTDLEGHHGPLAQSLASSWAWVDRMFTHAQEKWDVLSSITVIDEHTRSVILDATVDLAWFAPYETKRLRDAVNASATHPDNPGLASAATRRLDAWNQWATNRPSFPDGFTTAHAHTLCVRAGLRMDVRKSAGAKKKVREFLATVGHSERDNDLVAAGMDAWYGGVLDQFQDAHQRKAAGEPTWDTQWKQILASHSPV